MSVGIYQSFQMGASTVLYRVLILTILVVFFPLGAPNQPGTFLVGAMIILKYFGLDATGCVYLFLLLEATLGVFQNLINVIADIVTVTIEEEQTKTRKQAARTSITGRKPEVSPAACSEEASGCLFALESPARPCLKRIPRSGTMLMLPMRSRKTRLPCPA